MFVVKATQKFLARVLLLQYKRTAGQNKASVSCDSMQHDDTDQMSATTKDTENHEKDSTSSALSNGYRDGLKKEVGQPMDENVCFAIGESRKRTLVDGQDGNRQSHETGKDMSCKKPRLSGCPVGDGVGDITAQEIQRLCKDLMSSEEAATVLACLLVDLEPCEAPSQTVLLSKVSSHHEKRTLSALGSYDVL